MCSPTLDIIFSGRQSDLFYPHVEFSASVWNLYLPVKHPTIHYTLCVPTLKLSTSQQTFAPVPITLMFYFWTASAVVGLF